MTQSNASQQDPLSSPPGGSGSFSSLALAEYPAAPGVYLMRDAGGTVLYVGKAKNLRARLRSYFVEGADARLMMRFLRSHMASVETILTTTEKEAFLLENTLIKEHRPRCNIRLRDDKTYLSLRLDLGHEWPRIHRVRRRFANDSKAMYFGPFVSALALKETQRFLLALFPLRSCSDRVLVNRTRPCLLHQIGRCCAPCVGRVEADHYRQLVEGTQRFLLGRREDLLVLLRGKMDEYSEGMQYEKAAAVRDRLQALEETLEREQVVSHRRFDRDIIGFVRERGRVVCVVLLFRSGQLLESRSFEFKDIDVEDESLLEQFLSQYYDGLNPVPRDVLTAVEPSNAELVRVALSDLRGGPVRLVAPQRGQKRALIEMALSNARSRMERLFAGEESDDAVLKALKDRLGLSATPRRIECFDISNIQGAMAVGSMVSFEDGRPEKGNYRHFVIRTVEGANDFAMMGEVLERRYRRLLEEERPLPDLVIVDGGRGQLSAAHGVFESLGLVGRVALAALAKSKLKPTGTKGSTIKTRTEERIFLPGRKNPILFRRNDPALFLLQRIRDEAHRFGITFHRRLRSSSSMRSALDLIPGIGKVRRQQLLRHFGSVVRLREASFEALLEVPRLPRQVAETLYRYLHPAQGDLFQEEMLPSSEETDDDSLWDMECVAESGDTADENADKNLGFEAGLDLFGEFGAEDAGDAEKTEEDEKPCAPESGL